MNKALLLVTTLSFSLPVLAQNDGPSRLFANSSSRLTIAERATVYQKLGLKPAGGGRGFLSGDFEVEAQVFPTDLNGDGSEDVFVVLSSAAMYGATGQGYTLFLKNGAGTYAMQEESGSGIPAILKTKSNGFPDLLIAGPGFEHPVYRWNGKAYKLYRKVKDGSAEANAAQYLEDYSAAYVKTRK